MSAILDKHMVMYAIIKDEVVKKDFDPSQFKTILDSLRANRDSLILDMKTGAEHLQSAIDSLNGVITGLNEEVAKLKDDNEKMTFFLQQVKADMGIEAEGADAAGEAADKLPGLTDEAISQLKKLKELLDAGIISQEEFDAKKAKILQ
jgi:predicted Zn-dependent protease